MTDTLAKLFGSAARVKLLRLFLFNPRSSFSVADAAARARISPSDARRELNSFAAAGLVARSVRGRLARYTTNQNFEYTEALQNLLLNAPVQSAQVIERLRPTGSLKLVIVAGVFVGEWEGKIDLFVVADRIKEDKFKHAVKLLEAEIGKELRFAFLTTQEFFYRLNMNDHLVRDILDYTHRIILDRLDVGLE